MHCIKSSLKLKGLKFMKKIGFEDAIKRLEEIIGMIEEPETSIEASIELYKEAAELIKICTKTIDEAELQVKMLISGDKTEEEK